MIISRVKKSKLNLSKREKRKKKDIIIERAKWSSWLSDSMHIRMRSGHNGRSKF